MSLERVATAPNYTTICCVAINLRAELIMPAFVVKVTEPNGELMSPITVSSVDAATAEEMVRRFSFVGSADRVEAKELRDEVMKKAFGVQKVRIRRGPSRLDLVGSGPRQKTLAIEISRKAG
jgi:hypothetical protein